MAETKKRINEELLRELREIPVGDTVTELTQRAAILVLLGQNFASLSREFEREGKLEEAHECYETAVGLYKEAIELCKKANVPDLVKRYEKGLQLIEERFKP